MLSGMSSYTRYMVQRTLYRPIGIDVNDVGTAGNPAEAARLCSCDFVLVIGFMSPILTTGRWGHQAMPRVLTNGLPAVRSLTWNKALTQNPAFRMTSFKWFHSFLFHSTAH